MKNNQNWRKLGRVYVPDGSLWWAKSYAHLPTADVLNDDVIRIYYAGLDRDKFGRIGYVDVSTTNPTKVLYISSEPALDLGIPGTFDDSGVNPSCIVSMNGQKCLYYIGWQRAERVPYMLFAGLAVGQDDDSFKRVRFVPVLDRTTREPFLRSAVTIVPEDDHWRMWYVSGIGWIKVDGKAVPSYVIRGAVSADGVDWHVQDDICINLEDDEYGFGRPWVIKDTDIYRMWYSIRSRSRPYRIGYAESHDGTTWVRKDSQVGIQASSSGWDSEMICYPCVVDVSGQRILFYNGNQHGKSGFGVAVQES